MALELAISNLSFRYRKESPAVLQDVNLTVPAGSVCALLGPTNSGKTTLLQAVAGILGSHHREAVARGTIRIGNDSFAALPKKVLFPMVGLTSQDPYFQISGLRDSVREEISLTLETLGLPQTEIQDRIGILLDELGLSKISDRQPSTLSGGELQRVALANILIAHPHVLLLDEPTNSLDGVAQRRLASIMCALKGRTTVLLADYQTEFAIRTADQFVILDGGKIVFAGTRTEFFQVLSRFKKLLPVEHYEPIINMPERSVLRKRIMGALGSR